MNTPRRAVALAAVVALTGAGCARLSQPPEQDWSVSRARWDAWTATVDVAYVEPVVLNGRCGTAPPSGTANTVLFSTDESCWTRDYGPEGVQYAQEHEYAHIFAYRNNLWLWHPGDTCTGYQTCPPAERAAEAVLGALGFTPPVGWSDTDGYGSPTPEDAELARRALWHGGI